MPDKVLCKQLHATHAHNIRAHTRYPSYERIKAGDALFFSWKHRLVMRKVVQVMEYSDFGSMLRHQGVRACLPHLKDDDFTAALRVYHSFPNYKMKAKHYGVVAFKLAPLNRTPAIQSSFNNIPSPFLQAMVAEVDRVESMQNRSAFQPPTPPKMTGAASAPQSIELMQKVAQRIANGENYRDACEALGFNLNENNNYRGSNTSDYSRLKSQVRKVKNKKRKCDSKLLVERNMRLVEKLRKVTFHLQCVTERYRVLYDKLEKYECASSQKRKITHLSSSEKTKSKNDPVVKHY